MRNGVKVWKRWIRKWSVLVRRFLQLVTRNGLFIIWEWDYKDKAIVSDNFCTFKSCQHGMLDFCCTDCCIISYAATRCWIDAVTLVATIWLFKVSLSLSLSLLELILIMSLILILGVYLNAPVPCAQGNPKSTQQCSSYIKYFFMYTGVLIDSCLCINKEGLFFWIILCFMA